MTASEIYGGLGGNALRGSAGTALAQGTGGARAPSPGIGGGGIGRAAAFSLRRRRVSDGRQSGHRHHADPGYRNRHPVQHYADAWDRTTLIPGGTLTGGPPSSGPPGERSSSDKPSSDKPPNLGPARTLADIKEETEAGIVYQPCPAKVRFPNGQQICLGLPVPSSDRTTRRNSASPARPHVPLLTAASLHAAAVLPETKRA